MNERLEYYALISDMVLTSFDRSETGFISRTTWRADRSVSLPDEDEVFAFLVKEGLLKETRDGHCITFEGRFKIHHGGFRGYFRREHRDRMWMRVATISSVIAAVAGIIGLLVHL